MTPPPVVLVAPPQGRRARAFADSLARLGWPPARVVSYLELLSGQVHLADVVPAGAIVRLDSSGEDLATERALIELGGGVPTDLAAGELAPMQAWYRGYGLMLSHIDAQLAQAAPHQRCQHSSHILRMFDKRATHQLLSQQGVPVPQALSALRSTAGAAEILAAAQRLGLSQLFVKLQYGSSASGAVALRWAGPRIEALSTVQMQQGRLYNSRRLLRYSGYEQVHDLLDALAPHGLHAEQWIPKAQFAGKTIDLRVVVIGGRAQHTLLRMARGPITNLHLGAERGDVAALQAQLGQRWQLVTEAAEAACVAFACAEQGQQGRLGAPLYAGVDVLLSTGHKRAYVLEVNAFGDYHRGVWFEGRDTYQAQLLALS